MGQTAENLAFRFGITRREMDEFAAREPRSACSRRKRPDTSTARSCRCTTQNGKLYAADDGVREDSTVENLAKLKPFFDRKYGNVTAGNSSQITDGAAWLVHRVGARGRGAQAHADRPHRRLGMGGARSGGDGLGPVLRGHADPAAPWPRTQRSRCVGDQRSIRRAGDRAASAHGKTPTIASRSSAFPRAGRARRGEAQCRRRRDCARPSGRRVGRADRAARAQHAGAHRRQARHGGDLHRRRPGRRDAGRAQSRQLLDCRTTRR